MQIVWAQSYVIIFIAFNKEISLIHLRFNDEKDLTEFLNLLNTKHESKYQIWKKNITFLVTGIYAKGKYVGVNFVRADGCAAWYSCNK